MIATGTFPPPEAKNIYLAHTDRRPHHPPSGLAILLCHETLFYLRQTPRFLNRTPILQLPPCKPGDKHRPLPAASSADYIHLALGIDLAVEIPLILAFHPATLLYGASFNIPFPSIIQIALQLLVLLVVERSFHHWTIWFLQLGGRGGELAVDASSESPEQFFEPFSLAMDFMRPRGTLLIATAGLGVPSLLTCFTGKFHVVSVVAWVTLRQLQGS